MLRRQLLASTVVLGAAAVRGGSSLAQGRPMIGFLSIRTPVQAAPLVAAIHAGLKQEGFVDGENVAFDYRWAEGDMTLLPGLAADLVKRNVAVIIAGGTPQPAKSATSKIPIVFTTGLDPVAYDLVTSLSRPAGNLTGATFYSGALGGKQLEFLRELVPAARTFGILVKPDSASAAPQIEQINLAARVLGIEVQVVKTSVEADFEPALAAFARQPVPALIVSVDPYLDSRAELLVAAVKRHALPAIYYLRNFPDAGGLASYGASISDTYRQAGVYAGRILKGAKPADLPVVQPTRFELVINRSAAAAIGVTIPPTLAARADDIVD
jgi:putative ABC transport system substrate-binding protein